MPDFRDGRLLRLRTLAVLLHRHDPIVTEVTITSASVLASSIPLKVLLIDTSMGPGLIYTV